VAILMAMTSSSYLVTILIKDLEKLAAMPFILKYLLLSLPQNGKAFTRIIARHL